MSAPVLYLNHDPDLGWLLALPFGVTSDGQPRERWRDLSERFGFYLEPETDEVVGFGTGEFADLDLDDEALTELWTGPRFTAPLLGLTDASAGEILVAARAYFGRRPSLNRFWFELAAGQRGEDALAAWQNCLECGDSMAHFALGYTLYELGRFHEAYRHLRHYTELAPAQPWVWCWLGRAAAALGELDEAREAYEHAIELTEQGGDETDADDLLAALRSEVTDR